MAASESRVARAHVARLEHVSGTGSYAGPGTLLLGKRRYEGGSEEPHDLVLPGNDLFADGTYVRGHGTHVRNGRLVSSQAGTVLTVNRLVTVRPFRSRYVPEVGDVVVGRVLQVAGKRWLVDINAVQEASLLLSAITLPLGEQRKRTYEDELNMRAFFAEGDPISAEVQEIRSDASIALHTRSNKFGALRNGVLLQVSPSLIARAKKHYVRLSLGVSAILGTNGYIWLSPHDLETAQNEDKTKKAGSRSDAPLSEERYITPLSVGPEAHLRVARARNAILLLNARSIPIDPVSISLVCEECARQGVDVKDMTRREVASRIADTVQTQLSAASHLAERPLRA
ncbi:Exosome complex component rrp4 [Porphyridium purpureum]|uniref:Exosome complex component rrp4 n=1 Tax=Porphyridium purpureum TaxID=35688 RepID=A0A5J4YW04_PORPP|nr:Exosome complex component rrp4 [Porphyridium purpureum]|eukprot:POR7981..scf227_4